MATLGVRSRSLTRSLVGEFRATVPLRPNRDALIRTLLRIDKLGVTGSSPVPPIEKALHRGFLLFG